MKKSLLFLVVLIVFPFILLAGGGNQSRPVSGDTQTTIVDGREIVGNTFVTGLPIVKEPLTLKMTWTPHAQDQLANFLDRKPWVLPVERATGIKIEFMTVNAASIPAVLASGDLPDIINGNLINDNLLVQNKNLFMVLDDKLAKWAPNVLKFYEEYIEDWKEFLTLDDGHIYSLMGGYHVNAPGNISSITAINRNWLQSVGKQMPTTIIEFRDVLRAFRDQNVGNPGGQNNKIPLNWSTNPANGDIVNLAGPWGIQGDYNLMNGKIIPTRNSAEYREYLEFMHSLAAEKLLNVEGFTHTREQYTSQIASMNCGVFLGWGPANFISNQANLAPWDAIPAMSVPGKENLRIFPGNRARLASTRNTFIISRTSRNWEAALRWWDYLQSDQDMVYLVRYGEPGIGYLKLGHHNYQQLVPTEEQARTFGINSLGDYDNSIGLTAGSPILLSAPMLDVEKYPYSEHAWRMKIIPVMWDLIPNERIPRSMVSADKIQERTFIEIDLMVFMREFRADAILNGITDAKWNTYVRDLDTRFKYNEWIKWYQDYVDRKF